jgi:hypothetical protein
MEILEIRILIESGVDEYARACLNVIESAKPQQRAARKGRVLAPQR